MTFAQEYERMRPLDEENQPSIVWGNSHRRSWDPTGFLLRQAEKASAWAAAERKFMLGPGSGRAQVKKDPRPDPGGRAPSFDVVHDALLRAWFEAEKERERELRALEDFDARAKLSVGAKQFLNMLWEAKGEKRRELRRQPLDDRLADLVQCRWFEALAERAKELRFVVIKDFRGVEFLPKGAQDYLRTLWEVTGGWSGQLRI